MLDLCSRSFRLYHEWGAILSAIYKLNLLYKILIFIESTNKSVTSLIIPKADDTLLYLRKKKSYYKPLYRICANRITAKYYIRARAYMRRSALKIVSIPVKLRVYRYIYHSEIQTILFIGVYAITYLCTLSRGLYVREFSGLRFCEKADEKKKPITHRRALLRDMYIFVPR